MRKAYLFLLAFGLVLIIDMVTKAMVMERIRLDSSIPVIKGFFNLVHIRNKGIAFGLLASGSFSRLLPYVSLMILLGLVIYLVRLRNVSSVEAISFGLIVGGATGNLIDRIRFGEVVDFLDFYVGRYHWPAFNVADSAVTIGAGLLGLSLFLKAQRP